MSIKIGDKVRVIANNADYWKLSEEDVLKYDNWIGCVGIVIDEFTEDEFEVDFSLEAIHSGMVRTDGSVVCDTLWHISELEVIE